MGKESTRGWRDCQKPSIQAYELTFRLQVEGSAEKTIIGAMITQASKLGLSAEETDDYVQEIAITLLSGMFRSH